MAPKRKAPNSKPQAQLDPPPLTGCVMNSRCNTPRFMKFWKYKCQAGLTTEHHELLKNWPFRHFLDLPDMNMQRGFLLELLRRWDTSMNAFYINGNYIRPNGQDISLILQLRATGKSIDVHRRPGENVSSAVATQFFNMKAITLNQLEGMLHDELYLKGRTATPSEWVSMFTMFFFGTTLFPLSTPSTPMQFGEYVDKPSLLWEYQWGVAAFDYINRQLPELGYKAHNDQTCNPTLNGCSFALLTWFYEVVKPASLKAGVSLLPRFKNWELKTDCTQATFASLIKNIKQSDMDNGIFNATPRESWVFSTDLHEIQSKYNSVMPPYVYMTMTNPPASSRTPEANRTRSDTKTPPSVRVTRRSFNAVTSPRVASGPGSTSKQATESKLQKEMVQYLVSPPRRSPRQHDLRRSGICLSINQRLKLAEKQLMPSIEESTKKTDQNLSDQEISGVMTQSTPMKRTSEMIADEGVHTPDHGGMKSDGKPPLAPRKSSSEPKHRHQRRSINDIPPISEDFQTWIHTPSECNNHNHGPDVHNLHTTLISTKHAAISPTPPPVFDKSPFQKTPFGSGSPAVRFIRQALHSSPSPQLPNYNGRSAFMSGNIVDASDQAKSTSSASSVDCREIELTRQYCKTPFSQAELLQKNIDYIYSETHGFNTREFQLNYTSRWIIPTYMQRVIYAWHTGLILKDQEMVFQHETFEVTKSGLHGLLCGRALETSVIDTLMYILHSFNQDPGCTWSFVRCMHTKSVPYMPQSMLRQHEFSAYSSVGMEGKRWVILPIQSINHWFLVVFDFYDFEIKVYNNLDDCECFQQAVRDVTTIWRPYLNKIRRRSDVMDWPVRVKPSPYLNKCSNDVGLYIVKIVDCLVSNRPIEFPSDAMKSDRGRAAYNLIASSFFPGSFPPFGS